MATDKIAILEDEIKHIPLSDIFVDFDWNSRSLVNVLSEHSESKDGEGTGITGLTKGILLDGQDEPVILRATRTEGAGFYKKNVKEPYALVAGFRRFEAVRRLNSPKPPTKNGETEIPGEISAELAKLIENRKKEGKSVVPNTADGTLRAIVKPLTEGEAKVLNLRENTARDDLTTPDLMMAVNGIAQSQKLTGGQIADRLGKSQGHIDQLLRIGKCHADILQHWRHGGEFRGLPSSCRATVRELNEIAKETDGQKQLEDYTRLLQSKLPSADEAENNQWIRAAKNKAIKLGQLFGNLEKVGFLKVKVEGDWTDFVERMVKTGNKEPTRRQAKSIAKAAQDAYAEALTSTDDEEEDGDEAAAQ
jgi:hypothetical protein